jgi:nitrogen fixation-related uncharacterized protein
MFAIFGIGWGEIIVLAVIGAIGLFVFLTVMKRGQRVGDDDRATIRSLRDEIEDLRRENERLREQNDRLRATPAAPPIPPETGIKQSDA